MVSNGVPINSDMVAMAVAIVILVLQNSSKLRKIYSPMLFI